MAKTVALTTITISFGVNGTREVKAIPISSRMAVHEICDHNAHTIGSYRISDPVTGYGWPYDFTSEAQAVDWAKRFTAEFGDDPMPEAKVRANKSAWQKKPKRYQEIKTWILANKP